MKRNVNQALLQPIQPKTKSELYQLITGSKRKDPAACYYLNRSFAMMTEPQAKAVIKAIRAGEQEELPEGLNFGKREYGDPHKFDTKPRKRFLLGGLTHEDQDQLLECKKLVDQLMGFGLEDKAAIDEFLAKREGTEQDAKKLRSEKEALHAEIRTMFLMKKDLEAVMNPKFLDGPLAEQEKDRIGISYRQ